jgi:AbiV family abortive infection protein
MSHQRFCCKVAGMRSNSADHCFAMQTISFQRGSSSTVAALVMFAREELSKSRMLLEPWKQTRISGKQPGVEEVKAACEDHVEKQRTAILGWTLSTPEGTGLASGDTALAEALKAWASKPELPSRVWMDALNSSRN